MDRFRRILLFPVGPLNARKPNVKAVAPARRWEELSQNAPNSTLRQCEGTSIGDMKNGRSLNYLVGASQ
jgi:hypothetical protein